MRITLITTFVILLCLATIYPSRAATGDGSQSHGLAVSQVMNSFAQSLKDQRLACEFVCAGSSKRGFCSGPLDFCAEIIAIACDGEVESINCKPADASQSAMALDASQSSIASDASQGADQG